MSDLSNDQVQSLGKTVKAFLQEIHTAIERKDVQHLSELVFDDVFMFGAAANAVSIGKNQFVTNLHTHFEQSKSVELRVQPAEMQIGLCQSGRSAWFFDQIVLDLVENQEISRSIPIRFTGLLVKDQDWRLSAGYWSIPLRSNEYQFSLLQDGKIQPGVALEDQLTPEAKPLAQRLVEALAEPQLLPELHSMREDAVHIGSTVDEVFHATASRNFVKEIASLPLQFVVRGGIHGAVAADGCTAWMATHVDLKGRLTMPYRFFYIWLREQDKWEVVVSNDAVSIDPLNPGFDFP